MKFIGIILFLLPITISLHFNTWEIISITAGLNFLINEGDSR